MVEQFPNQKPFHVRNIALVGPAGAFEQEVTVLSERSNYTHNPQAETFIPPWIISNEV